MLERIRGSERGGAFAPARPGDVDLADAAHAVPVEVGPDGVPCFLPARERGQLVQEAVVLDVAQKGDDFRMRADHVRDVEERQPHLRGDVVGDGLCERVGRVLLAQPLLQLLVEPPRRLHRRHDHLMASRIEQDPAQLLEVGQDEVEQRRPGLRLGCRASTRRRTPHCAPISSVTRAGSVSIVAGATPGTGSPGPSSGERRDEVVAVEDGLQRVPRSADRTSPRPPEGRRGSSATPASG